MGAQSPRNVLDLELTVNAAIGMLMQRLLISRDAAYELILAASKGTRRTTAEASAAYVAMGYLG